jgi:hypothetical protein
VHAAPHHPQPPRRQDADADESEDKLRFHTSNDYPIVRCKDLARGPGDEIKFDLVQPIGGKPIMGSAYAEGNGDPMDFAFDSLRINQYRKPISGGDSMTQQRTPHQLRKLAGLRRSTS